MNRVALVLESISDDIAAATSSGLVEGDGTFAVPLGLRRAIANTAIIMIEAQSPEKFRANKERQNAKRQLDKRVDAFKEKHGRDPNEEELAELKAGEKWAPQKKAAADEKAAKKKKADDEAANADKADKAEKTPDPEDSYLSKAGKPLRGDAARQVFQKRRRTGALDTGAEREFKAKGKAGDVAALRKAGEDLKSKLQGAKEKEEIRPKFKRRPGVAPGGRQAMPTPRFGQSRSQFNADQAAKGQDLDWLEKERQRRSGVVGKAGKLARMRGKGWGSGQGNLRGQHHDEPKGYDRDPAKLHEPRRRAAWGGHHVDTDGEQVHSSGKKANKKFANDTTFRDSDTDALLHTDKSKDGARGDANASEFVFHGDVKKDPREKWYRVSKEGGYASAMASLGKSYHKDPKMRSPVMSAVKKTGFVDGKGHQINVKPTGALHNERGPCVRDNRGVLNTTGRRLQRRDPSEWSRLCKGAHGPSGTPTRNEYERGFDPRHDDAHKVRKLHKAAEIGKVEIPHDNIKAHADARPGRRQDIHDITHRIGRQATRTRWAMRNG
jgi:hypothetical protein